MFSFNLPSASWHIFFFFNLEEKSSQTVNSISVSPLEENPAFLLFEMSVNLTCSVYVTGVQSLKKLSLNKDGCDKIFLPRDVCLPNSSSISIILYK